jgi:beta-lactam-binding protein with PASTA domain
MSTPNPTFDNTGISFDDTGYTFDGGIPIPIGRLVLPNLVGLELYDGIEVLQAAGVYVPAKIGYFGTFPISVIWQQSNIEPGTILLQMPIAGTGAVINELITLNVSAYPVSVAFP